VTKLYSSEYKELNVNYLLKILARSKKIIISLTLLTTFFSIYLAYSLDPVYKSEALLKIGYYFEIDINGDGYEHQLEGSNELSKLLTFEYIGKGDKQSEIVQISPIEKLGGYIKIVSEGKTPKQSVDVIKNLANYVQNEHLKAIINSKEKHKLTLENTTNKLNSIKEKKEKYLLNGIEESFDTREYESLLFKAKLMEIVDDEVSDSYVSDLLKRVDRINSILHEERFTKNSSIYGDIQTFDKPIKPRKILIIFFGFFLGIFLSITVILFKEFFIEKKN
jgi:hypothetical protein